MDIVLGSISAMEKKSSKALNLSFKLLQKRVDRTKVAYVDETSFRKEAQTRYVWTAITDQGTLLRVLKARGSQSLKLHQLWVQGP